MEKYLLISLRVLAFVAGACLVIGSLIFGPWIIYPGYFYFNEAVALLVLAILAALICFAGAVNPKYLVGLALIVLCYFLIGYYFEYKNRQSAMPYCKSLIKQCEIDNLDGTECTKFPKEVEKESNALLKYCMSITNGN